MGGTAPRGDTVVRVFRGIAAVSTIRRTHEEHWNLAAPVQGVNMSTLRRRQREQAERSSCSISPAPSSA